MFSSRKKLSFQAKFISLGVAAKAILMGVLVSLLAVADFAKSIVLVLVSAIATGIFGIIIVIIQGHMERSIHARLDTLEHKQDDISSQTTSIDEKTAVIANKVR